MAKFYHKYETIFWRFWRFLERFQKKVPFEEFDENKTLESQIPFTNRQDLRCYYLHEKGRVEIDKTYGPKIKRDSDDRSEY